MYYSRLPVVYHETLCPLHFSSLIFLICNFFSCCHCSYEQVHFSGLLSHSKIVPAREERSLALSSSHSLSLSLSLRLPLLLSACCSPLQFQLLTRHSRQFLFHFTRKENLYRKPGFLVDESCPHTLFFTNTLSLFIFHWNACLVSCRTFSLLLLLPWTLCFIFNDESYCCPWAN